jgi:hypothetical protein
VGQPTQPHLAPSQSRDGSGVSPGEDPPSGDAHVLDLLPDFAGDTSRSLDWAAMSQDAQEEADRALLGHSSGADGLVLDGAGGTGMMAPGVFTGLPLVGDQGVAHQAVDDRPPAGDGGEEMILGDLTSQTPPVGQSDDLRDSDPGRTSADTEEDGGDGSSQEGQGSGQGHSGRSPHRSPSSVRKSP